MIRNDYYLYKHTNLSNGKVYIGISCQTPEQRWRYGLGYKDQSKFYGAILKYGWEGFSHEIIKTNLTQEEAYTLEQELIKEYDSIKNGYNIQNGGDDVGIWARENLSTPIYQINSSNYQVINEYESISDAARDFGVAPTAISKAIQEKGLSAGYYWSKIDEYNGNWTPRKNLNESSIYKINSSDFSIIEEYKSIIDAAKKNNISPSGLHRCNDFFSLGGFCWCKTSEWYEGWKPTKKPNTATPVYQIEVGTLRILNEWPSIVEASRVLKINKTVIGRCCQNKGIVAGGFHWCRVENWTENWKPKEQGPTGSPGRPVYQIDKGTLAIINRFNSLPEASVSVGSPISCLAKAASGKAAESAGYYWCYVDLYEGWKPKPKKKTGPSGKKVIQFSLDGSFIKEWNSVKEAAEEYGISAATISNVCAGRINSAAGYKWRY